MDITVEQLMQNSFVISINDKVLQRFNSIFTTADLTPLPKHMLGFRFNAN